MKLLWNKSSRPSTGPTRSGIVRLLAAALCGVAAVSTPLGEAHAQGKAAPKFAYSAGWTEGESGQHLLNAFKECVKNVNGTLTVADAAYDAKRQSDQINALVAAKPDALFVSASDPAAIAPAIKRAVDAKIPVFAVDSLIPGVLVNSTALSSNFNMGAQTAEYIAKRLNGKGNIALVELPANETWDQRAQGLHYALAKYPDIKIVASWAYNSSGSTTARQGVEGLLNANPNLDAIWCAWDGAAIEGALAIKASKRNIITTGIDGGKQAFSALKTNGPMVMTAAQCFYEMADHAVKSAVDFLNGKKVPRLIVTPTYEATSDLLDKSATIPDDYDRPGKADELGWKRL